MSHRFDNLAELRSAIQHSKDAQAATSGQWTLAQIFYHLAAAFEGSVETLTPGYPRIVRILVRPFRWVVIRFRFPPWLPIPGSIRQKLEPPVDAILEEQYERLVQAIDRFETFTGSLSPHPVLGPLSRQEWIGFHLNHCRHHFSFVDQTATQQNSKASPT